MCHGYTFENLHCCQHVCCGSGYSLNCAYNIYTGKAYKTHKNNYSLTLGKNIYKILKKRTFRSKTTTGTLNNAQTQINNEEITRLLSAFEKYQLISALKYTPLCYFPLIYRFLYYILNTGPYSFDNLYNDKFATTKSPITLKHVYK